LAELGADVVKVESRERPEALRAYYSVDHPSLFEPSGIQTTVLFTSLTRSMCSLCLEMSTEIGRKLFKELVGQCDVVVENLGPGQMERWGCSFKDLIMYNPKLVMISISGFGRTGPRSGYRAYGSTIESFVGLISAWVPDGTHFDFIAGIHGASAVIAALAQVESTGTGTYIDLAQSESGAAVMAPLYLDYLANKKPWHAGPNQVPGSLLSTVVRCAGHDAWMAIELEDAADWADLCGLLERSDLRLKSDWASDEERRQLQEAIQQWASELTPFQATFRLQHAGLAAGPVQNTEDLWRDAQLRTRGAIVEVTHPDVPVVELPNSPDRMSETPGRVRLRGPRLGEHSAEIVSTWLGLADEEVHELLKQGAIWYPQEGQAHNDSITNGDTG
jgi:crotonobetainyl-CoA:carnitine CoA-transferase CaiB-like acyl-CoA transferase